MAAFENTPIPPPSGSVNRFGAGNDPSQDVAKKLGDMLDILRKGAVLENAEELNAKIIKLYDSQRKLGASAEEAARFIDAKLGKSIQALGIEAKDSGKYIKDTTSILNRSFNDLANMGMKQLGAGIPGLNTALSLIPPQFKAIASLALGGALALKLYVDGMAQVNKMAYQLTAAGGGFAGKGGNFNVSKEQTKNIFDTQQMLINMGIGTDKQGALAGAIGKSFPLRSTSGAGTELMRGIGGMSTVTNIDQDQLVKWSAGLARANTPISEFTKMISNAAKDFDDMPTEEVAGSMYEVWQNSRKMGASLNDSTKIVKDYHVELRSGIKTWQDIATTQAGARQPIGQQLQVATLAKQYGVWSSKSNDPFKMASEMMNMRANDPKQFEAMMEKLVSKMARAQGSDTEAMRSTILKSGLDAGLSQAEQDLIIFGRVTEETTRAMQKMHEMTGKEVDKSFGTFTDDAQKIARAMMNLEEEVKRLNETMKTQGQKLLVAPSRTGTGTYLDILAEAA